jgi:hypothetical protein
MELLVNVCKHKGSSKGFSPAHIWFTESKQHCYIALPSSLIYSAMRPFCVPTSEGNRSKQRTERWQDQKSIHGWVEVELSCYIIHVSPGRWPVKEITCKIAQWKEQPQKHRTSTAMKFQGRPKRSNNCISELRPAGTLKADRKQHLPRADITRHWLIRSNTSTWVHCCIQQNFL